MTRQSDERFPDVGRASLIARVGGGLGFALTGVGFALRRPELRWPALLAVALNLVVYGALAVLGLYLLPDLSPDPEAYEGWMRTVMGWASVALRVALVVVWLLVSVWLAVVIGGLLSGPLFDLLSERTEEILIGRRVSTEDSFVGGLRLALRELLIQGKLLVVNLFVVVLLLVVSLIPLVGQIASPVLAWVWTALWITMSFAGPVTARHGLSATERLRILLDNKALATGFGALGGVPLLSFFLLPLLGPGLIVGMTRLFLALAAHDRVASRLTEAEKEELRFQLPMLPGA